MNGDREWNDRLRPDEVETVPPGKPVRDLAFLAIAAVALVFLMSRWPAPAVETARASPPPAPSAHAVRSLASATATRAPLPARSTPHRTLASGRELPGD